MNYDEQRPFWQKWAFALGAFSILIFTNCQGDLPTVPEEAAFTKPKLEKLGDLLRQELLAHNEFLPQLPPYDTSVYWYLNTLYTQATSTIHLDKQSSSDNRWDQLRQWQVNVIKDDSARLAFVLPGGDLFISTGMLLNLREDYELYAVLSFEATLMNDGHLLSKMIKEYNSLTLNNLIEGEEQPNALSAAELAQTMQQFVFDPEVVEVIDQVAVDNTCGTSILSPLGLVPMLSNPSFEGSIWLQTRPSYAGRVNHLPEMASFGCNGRQHGDNYQRFVLDRL